MLKRIFFGAVCTLLFSASVYAASDVTVTINDETVSFDKDPIIIENRAMVPLRGLFEELGYSIDWDSDNKTALISNENTNIEISPNNYTYVVNGEAVECDVPAQLVESSLYLPLRTIVESTDLTVDWDSDTKTVKIYTNDSRSLALVSTNSYLQEYSDIVAPLEQKSHIFDNLVIDGSNLDEDLLPEIEEYSDMLQEAYENMEKMNVPASLEELHNLHLQSVEKYIEFCNVIIDYYNNEITQSELDKEIQYINNEITTLENKMVNALNKI